MFEDRRKKDEEDNIKEKVVQIRRVTKVVKGGKRMGFRALVVVGDQLGSVGVGIAKASEVSSAIRKAVEGAKKRQIKVEMVGRTIPHDITGVFGASKVIMRPAPVGTGVIAGGAVRIIMELAGIKDIVAKSIGSSNAINSARAAMEGLSSLRSLAQEEERRGKSLNVKLVQAG